MLHDALKIYLDEVEQAILQFGHAHVERYVEEILTANRINLRIRLRTASGHLLEIHDAVIVVDEALVHLDYRYHCQVEKNRLRFRYDSTPHFPGLPTFPHHKHLPDDNVIACDKPSILQVLREAMAGSQ